MTDAYPRFETGPEHPLQGPEIGVEAGGTGAPASEEWRLLHENPEDRHARVTAAAAEIATGPLSSLPDQIWAVTDTLTQVIDAIDEVPGIRGHHGTLPYPDPVEDLHTARRALRSALTLIARAQQDFTEGPAPKEPLS